jgi:hypothetical protein
VPFDPDEPLYDPDSPRAARAVLVALAVLIAIVSAVLVAFRS